MKRLLAVMAVIGLATAVHGVSVDEPLPSGRTDKAVESAARSTKATVKMRHHPVATHFVPGKRIELFLKVKDPSGIKEARCYFRSEGSKQFVFVPMARVERSALVGTLDFLEGERYRGILPAPDEKIEAIEYAFLIVNGNGDVVKSQTFRADKREGGVAPAWQKTSGDEPIRVFTDLEKSPKDVPGFGDNIQMDVADSAARFGMAVEGLYIAKAGAAAGASGGTATAGTSAFGATAIAGAGAAAVVVGGVALSGGGGGGGGGGDEGGGGNGPVERFAGTISGSWGGDGLGGSFTMNVSEDGSISGSFGGDASGGISGSVSGSGNVRAAGGSASYSTEWSGRLVSNGDNLVSGSGTWSSDEGANGTWSGN